MKGDQAAAKKSLRGLVTRGGAAKALGVSVAMVRKWERTGALEPVQYAGVNYFNERDVELFRAQRAGKPRRISDANNVSGAVFDLLAVDTEPVEIVRKLRVHPDVVEQLHHQWSRMRRSVVWTEADVAKIADAIGGRAFASAADLLTGIASHVRTAVDKARTETVTCAVCRSDPARFCAGCSPSRRRA